MALDKGVLLIIDGKQTIYPEIEELIARMRSQGAKVALVGKYENESLLKIIASEHSAEFTSVINEETLDDRCRVYRGLIDRAEVIPSKTLIVSNLGQDLAAAILIGCEFAWAMDYG